MDPRRVKDDVLGKRSRSKVWLPFEGDTVRARVMVMGDGGAKDKYGADGCSKHTKF